MDCKDQVEEDCNLILKDWLTESLVTVRNLFNNDSMIRDCLHDFLGDIDQKSCVPGDVSYIEFKPHHVINGDKGSLQDTKLLEILSKHKMKDTQQGFEPKFHVIVEDFGERHHEISNDWSKAKNIYQTSLE